MKWLFQKLRARPRVARGGIPGVVLYDANGRGLKLPEGSRVQIQKSDLYVNSQPPVNFGHLDGWQPHIPPHGLDRVEAALPGCKWV